MLYLLSRHFLTDLTSDHDDNKNVKVVKTGLCTDVFFLGHPDLLLTTLKNTAVHSSVLGRR